MKAVKETYQGNLLSKSYQENALVQLDSNIYKQQAQINDPISDNSVLTTQFTKVLQNFLYTLYLSMSSGLHLLSTAGFIVSSIADPVHFFKSGSADPVFKKRIRIRVTQKRQMLWHFLTKSKHLMTLKIKDKKLFGRNCISDNFI